MNSWNLNKLKDYETRNNGHQINKKTLRVRARDGNNTIYLEVFFLEFLSHTHSNEDRACFKLK